MLKNIYQTVFLAFVFGIIASPAIKQIYSDGIDNNDENRALAKPPIYPKTISGLRDYTKEVEGYVSDRFGYRKMFINTANQIRFHLFNESSSKQITIGKHGYIYLNSHSKTNPNSFIKDICDINQLTKKNQVRISTTINNFLNYFTAKGYDTKFAVIPSKSRIYPENLPDFESRWCLNIKPTKLEESLNYVNKQFLYYPKEKFLAWKEFFAVYLPKHFHWNGLLPYKVSTDIMLVLWNIQPDFDVVYADTVIGSDLSRHLQGVKLDDASVKYNYTDQNITECKGKSCIKNFNKYYKNGSIVSYSRPPSNNRHLLLLTDSFGAQISKHFIRGFDKVNLINLNHLTEQEQKDFFEYILKTINPTHLLYLVHDGAVNWRTIRLKKMLEDFQVAGNE